MNLHNIAEALIARWSLKNCRRGTNEYQKLFKKVSREAAKLEEKESASWRTIKNGKTTWNIPENEGSRLIDSPELNRYVIDYLLSDEVASNIESRTATRLAEYRDYIDNQWAAQKAEESEMSNWDEDPESIPIDYVAMEIFELRNLITALVGLRTSNFDFDQFKDDSNALFIMKNRREMQLYAGDLPDKESVEQEEALRTKLGDMKNYITADPGKTL